MGLCDALLHSHSRGMFQNQFLKLCVSRPLWSICALVDSLPPYQLATGGQFPEPLTPRQCVSQHSRGEGGAVVSSARELERGGERPEERGNELQWVRTPLPPSPSAPACRHKSRENTRSSSAEEALRAGDCTGPSGVWELDTKHRAGKQLSGFQAKK